MNPPSLNNPLREARIKPIAVAVPSCCMDRLPSGDIEITTRNPTSALPENQRGKFIIKPAELPAIVAFLADCINYEHEH